MNVEETELKDVYKIYVIQDRVQYQSIVDTVLNHRVWQKTGYFLKNEILVLTGCGASTPLTWTDISRCADLPFIALY